MMPRRNNRDRACGAVLVEVVLAAGVLAAAVPMVFWALAEAGRTFAEARAETRAAWIVPACVAEWKAGPAAAGSTIVNPVWALVFSQEGEMVGVLDGSDDGSGMDAAGAKGALYIASVKRRAVSGKVPDALDPIDVLVEYPAGADAARRRRIEFHTLMP